MSPFDTAANVVGLDQRTTGNNMPHPSVKVPLGLLCGWFLDTRVHFYAVERGRKHIADRKEKVYNTSFVAIMSTFFHSEALSGCVKHHCMSASHTAISEWFRLIRFFAKLVHLNDPSSCRMFVSINCIFTVMLFRGAAVLPSLSTHAAVESSSSKAGNYTLKIKC